CDTGNGDEALTIFEGCSAMAESVTEKERCASWSKIIDDGGGFWWKIGIMIKGYMRPMELEDDRLLADEIGRGDTVLLQNDC
ncbi:hypothetical protein A2U01_0033265, partial [Trifolium medium]|nr:hypothetical protein [Trifolium medium]